MRFTRTIAELPTPPRVLTDFSSAGPTPFDLLLKPDISAPGEAILSSVPLASTDYPGAFASWEGTSMAAPAVTGVVALMRERHPEWTPAQIRSALIGSAVPAYADSNATVEASPLRTGGGFVDAAGAVEPGVLSDPPVLGFGLQRPGATVTIPVSVTDAGDGAGVWAVAIDRHARLARRGRRTRAPGAGDPAAGAVLLPVTLAVAATAAEGDAAGYVVLTQGARTRRIPYWAHVERPRLATATRPAPAPSGHRARIDARPARSRRSATATPPTPARSACPVRWRGGEALYRFHLARRAINAGVTVEALDGGGLRPFLMRGLDENRVAGESGLPIDVGPSLTDEPVPSAGLYCAPAGDYAVAVDSAKRARRRIPAALLGQRRDAAGARPAARLGRRPDAADPDHGRGLGRRSALPRVRARAAGLDRSTRACRPDWDVRTASRRSPSGGCPRAVCARHARGRLRGVARRARDRDQPAARAHARDRADRSMRRGAVRVGPGAERRGGRGEHAGVAGGG